MDRFYDISEMHFDNDFLIINVDNIAYKIRISDASNKLAGASEQIRNDYKISPSGYGIHWRQLDEDSSINGLIRIAEK